MKVLMVPMYVIWEAYLAFAFSKSFYRVSGEILASRPLSPIRDSCIRRVT